MRIRTTLLRALALFGEDETVLLLATGRLRLTGAFRGRETEVVAQWAEAA